MYQILTNTVQVQYFLVKKSFLMILKINDVIGIILIIVIIIIYKFKTKNLLIFYPNNLGDAAHVVKFPKTVDN